MSRPVHNTVVFILIKEQVIDIVVRLYAIDYTADSGVMLFIYGVIKLILIFILMEKNMVRVCVQ